MSPKQYKKVKLYRALKVFFYCCGLPLFVFAVFCTAIKFIGHDPFNGEATFTRSLDMLQVYERTLSGSSLIGVWFAFAIWAIIAIFQIIFAKTIKNRRARMFATVAITMVLMLGALLVIDTVYARKIDGFTNPINGEHTAGLIDDLPDGVTMEDYRTQLSYYRTISTNAAKKDMTKILIDKIDLLKRVYNVEMEGLDKIGSAGNVSNDPITYATIISDDGQMGVDISFKDGKLQLEEVNKTTVEHKALLGGSMGFAVTDNIIYGDDNPSLPSQNWHWGMSLNKSTSVKTYDANNTTLPDYWDPTNPRYLSRNGEVCQEANQVIRLCPTADGKLVINGIEYSHYVAVSRTDLDGNEYYVWYTKDLYPANYDFENKKGVITDGIYGKAIYNNNGNIADGWVFSLYNVLEILEDYYGAPIEINNIIASDKTLPAYDKARAQIIANAAERRLIYYTGKDSKGNTKDASGNAYTVVASKWEQALYRQEVYNSNKFSFTHYRLDALLAEVGGLLGKNTLFDYLLAGGSALGTFIDPFVDKLRAGTTLGGLIGSLVDPSKLTGVWDVIKKIYDDKLVDGDGNPIELTEVFIKLEYPTKDETDPNITNLKLEVRANDGYMELVSSEQGTFTGARYSYVDGSYVYDSAGAYKKSGLDYAELTPAERGTYLGKRYSLSDGKYVEDSAGIYKESPILIDIDFSNELKEYREENPDFAFDLDHLSEFLNRVLNKFVDLSGAKSILGTVLNVAGGLIKIIDTSDGGVALNIALLGSTMHIQLLDADYKFAIDIDGILLSLLDGLYYYESSAIQPLWNFYVGTETDKAVATYQNEKMNLIAKQFADMDRAYFTGTKYGSLIGSTLIGDTLGANLAMSGGVSYDSKYGLTDLASVEQVKWDLSYMPDYFPIYGLREMIALLSGVVVVAVFLSYYAAEREYLYATGQLIPKERKKKKGGEEPDEDEANADGEEKPEGEETPQQETEAEPKDEESGKKSKKDKKSKKAKGEPAAEEGADVPVPEKSDKEVR